MLPSTTEASSYSDGGAALYTMGFQRTRVFQDPAIMGEVKVVHGHAKPCGNPSLKLAASAVSADIHYLSEAPNWLDQ